jgi:hypothetical protein
VVAADVDVGHPEARDRSEVGVLCRRTVVGDVTGVDDHVHVELLHGGGDDLPRGRVEMQVADVQDLRVVGRRVEQREVQRRVVQPRDAAHDAAELVGVHREVVGDGPRVADKTRDGRDQPLEARPLHPGGVPGGGGDRVRGDGHRQRDPTGLDCTPSGAQQQQRHHGRPDGRDQRVTPRHSYDAGAHVGEDPLFQPVQPGRVLDEGAGALLVDRLHLDGEAWPGVRRQRQPPERLHLDVRAAAYGRLDREPGVQRADLGVAAAGDLQPQPRPTQRHRDEDQPRAQPPGAGAPRQQDGATQRSTHPMVLPGRLRA